MRIFPIVFLIVVFVSVLLVSEFVYKKEPMQTQNAVADESNVNKCPSILIKKGNEMILYDDNKNQINSFSSLDEYIDYLKRFVSTVDSIIEDETVSFNFVESIEQADIVIVKGRSVFETLFETNEKLEYSLDLFFSNFKKKMLMKS